MQYQVCGCAGAVGRGVVYYGSARLRKESVHWQRARALGRDVAQLLRCPTWSGGGPGMMQAASEGIYPEPIHKHTPTTCLRCWAFASLAGSDKGKAADLDVPCPLSSQKLVLIMIIWSAVAQVSEPNCRKPQRQPGINPASCSSICWQCPKQ